MVKEVKLQKESEKKAEEYKKVYLERLTAYGAKDASELNDEQLTEFLDGMKSYRKNKYQDETIKYKHDFDKFEKEVDAGIVHLNNLLTPEGKSKLELH
jgi:hypothetical protein